jgi:hypothetical protein
MPRPSLVVAVVEDERHRMLIYRYLRRRGLSSHEIRTKPSPSGQGSAEQWVRTMYAEEVRAYRIRHAKAVTALVVMIDADTDPVQNRLTQLDEALEERGLPRIGNAEQIVRLVPKRNVETWIVWLTEDAANEETDYKRTGHDWHELVPHASERLFQLTGANAALPANCIDSLRKGISELNRLQF